MKEATADLLLKAERAIHSAMNVLKDGDLDFAASRAYYAMFYTAEALLEEKGLKFSKHGGVHGAFAQHFVKTGYFEAKYQRWLVSAFSQRYSVITASIPISTKKMYRRSSSRPKNSWMWRRSI